MARGLNKIRSKKFPKCSSAEDLDNILKTNPKCRESFGRFRNRDYYQETLKLQNSFASVFVCEQLVEQLETRPMLYGDGTFGVLPLNFKQLFIVMGDVCGMVRVKKV